MGPQPYISLFYYLFNNHGRRGRDVRPVEDVSEEIAD